jgi:hypothetical protein
LGTHLDIIEQKFVKFDSSQIRVFFQKLQEVWLLIQHFFKFGTFAQRTEQNRKQNQNDKISCKQEDNFLEKKATNSQDCANQSDDCAGNAISVESETNLSSDGARPTNAISAGSCSNKVLHSVLISTWSYKSKQSHTNNKWSMSVTPPGS